VNTKVALVRNGRLTQVFGRPFEIQRAPETLSAVLTELATQLLGSAATTDARHAVTMTAELSQAFRRKRDGVDFVLTALERAFPQQDIQVFTVAGGFVSPEEARRDPLSVAAANWAATAALVATHQRDALLIDVGTTTADVIPIAGGRVVARGRTDPDRLASGELVYTGAVRTPIEAICPAVPYLGGTAGTSAEGFALTGDAYVWRGDLAPEAYSVPTPDGRPASRDFAGERLARVVCADREMIDEAGITAIAEAVYTAQVEQIAAGIRDVQARDRFQRAIVTGVGTFLAAAAARTCGLEVDRLGDTLGDAAARCAPASAVALLLSNPTRSEAHTAAGAGGQRHGASQQLRSDAAADITPCVVKIGGSLLAEPDRLQAVIRGIEEAHADHPLPVVIVPGGGPFADVVRRVDAALGLTPGDAHWMAILGMDQYAHVLASRFADRPPIVASRARLAPLIDARRIVVVAPSAWLREADPLPHSWDVTGDSIAAWIAGAIGAPRLLLVKAVDPETNSGSALTKAGLTDAAFIDSLPSTVAVEVFGADQMSELRRALISRAAAINTGVSE